MAKNNVIQKYEEELDEIELDEFDFSDEMESHNEEALAGMMNGLMEAGQHQQMMALELTRLIVDKCSIDGINEDKILDVFKRASKTVAESFPLKEFCEKF